ncbi:N-acetylglucosaminyl transferase component Gpi1 [Xylona heveae TC161]|uniref:N-acetylglucosaminyl transferase component Gpi1 n=1 Tax=Xylona heveae (strain CBS 132557 / TC161) TaxID=1328760 RepID=A0A165G9I1_XYLHT|nr:N-acetylglucosaminyl transferase component Gpi1 [Xylona heveae TC161]KZF21906.1 N-acetylglucosaminyl transferase component Gpi1 [Xylona heveae TC161]
MHAFSILTLGIFIAGYITARWDLVTRLYELAIFAWDHGVVTRATKGFAILSVFFFLLILPAERLAAHETILHPRVEGGVIMLGGHKLMRVFWPLDIIRTASTGVIVGWRNSDLDIVVVTVLEDVEARSVENALRIGTLFRGSPHPVGRIYQLCGKVSMQVLGTLNPSNPPPTTLFNSSHIFAFTNASSQPPRIHCPQDSAISVQIILFEKPHPTRMQFMSLNPMSLALDDKPGHAVNGSTALDSVDLEAEKERQRKSRLVEKIGLHTVVRHPPSEKELALPAILTQINCSFEMGALLRKNIGLVGVRPRRHLSVSERVVESATTMWDNAILGLTNSITIWLLPILIKVFIVFLVFHRAMAELILRVLEWRLRPEFAALKDISATAQQVDIRLQQFCYWPIQYLTLRSRKDDWESITDSHPDYIRFYNSLWLVANDVIIGIALGSYIIENAEWVAYQIDSILSSWTIEGLQRMISWLMFWPAGLKLNTELAAFLGDLFLWVIDYWAGCVANLRPLLPQVIYFIGFSSFAGASVPIALFSDLLSLLTLHIYSFYIASARIYNWQLTIIISLFHLFRGKKRNVLRNRIDSCDYDLDQLLLGTILFTLLFFLLPTVAVFYLTFASARMIIISLKAALDTLLACLNHFPLFALMLRVKDSKRLPGGIRFELYDTQTASTSLRQESNMPRTSYIRLKSVPLSLRAMFQQYFQLGHRLRKHYLAPHVSFCLVTGRFVPPIHRRNLYSLQYSMLPATRASIAEVWKRLTERPAKATRVRVSQGNINSRRGYKESAIF